MNTGRCKCIGETLKQLMQQDKVTDELGKILLFIVSMYIMHLFEKESSSLVHKKHFDQHFAIFNGTLWIINFKTVNIVLTGRSTLIPIVSHGPPTFTCLLYAGKISSLQKPAEPARQCSPMQVAYRS